MVPWFGARITSNVLRYVSYDHINTVLKKEKTWDLGVNIEVQEAGKVVQRNNMYSSHPVPPVVTRYAFVERYQKQYQLILVRCI